MKEIPRIASFTVDHDSITPGVYISRMDGDIWVMPNGEHWHLGGKAK